MIDKVLLRKNPRPSARNISRSFHWHTQNRGVLKRSRQSRDRRRRRREAAKVTTHLRRLDPGFLSLSFSSPSSSLIKIILHALSRLSAVAWPRISIVQLQEWSSDEWRWLCCTCHVRRSKCHRVWPTFLRTWGKRMDWWNVWWNAGTWSKWPEFRSDEQGSWFKWTALWSTGDLVNLNRIAGRLSQISAIRSYFPGRLINSIRFPCRLPADLCVVCTVTSQCRKEFAFMSVATCIGGAIALTSYTGEKLAQIPSATSAYLVIYRWRYERNRCHRLLPRVN